MIYFYYFLLSDCDEGYFCFVLVHIDPKIFILLAYLKCILKWKLSCAKHLLKVYGCSLC